MPDYEDLILERQELMEIWEDDPEAAVALGAWWDEMQDRRIFAHKHKLIRPLSLLIEMLHMIELAYRVFDNDDNPIDFWLEQLTPEERKVYKL